MSEDPVHQNTEGKWCFWDEVWSDEIGLYDSEEECREQLEIYIREVLGD